VLGMSKGTVLFVPTDELNSVYTRVSLHREAVLHIKELGEHFISVCEANTMSIWTIENQKLRVFSLEKIYRPLKDIKVSDDKVVFAFEAGDLWVMKYDSVEAQLRCLMLDSLKDHTGTITSIDVHQDAGLIITGSIDKSIKIWNTKKQIIREIKFPDSIESVKFLNPEGSILVGHAGHVSGISH
jgi:WD40 repeat protein